MRRTIFLALLAALVLASPAAADPVKILRDCNDDGALQGDYTTSELREAQKALPTDIDEYSDCRDVLSRAIANKTTSKRDTDNAGGSGTGGTGGGSTPDQASTPDPTGTTAPAPTPDPNAALAPSSPQDNQALADAARTGGSDVKLGAGEAQPIPVKLTSSVGRNGVPTTLLVALALLALAASTAVVPGARRLAHARRKP